MESAKGVRSSKGHACLASDVGGACALFSSVQCALVFVTRNDPDGSRLEVLATNDSINLSLN